MSRIFDQLRRLEQRTNSAQPSEQERLAGEARKRQGQPRNSTSRLPVLIPLKIKGKDTDGQAFEEDSRTIVVALHSMLITMTHEVALGAEIGIENLVLGRSSRGRVVWRSGETNEVGVYLSDVEEICGVKLAQKPDRS